MQVQHVRGKRRDGKDSRAALPHPLDDSQKRKQTNKQTTNQPIRQASNIHGVHCLECVERERTLSHIARSHSSSITAEIRENDP